MEKKSHLTTLLDLKKKKLRLRKLRSTLRMQKCIGILLVRAPGNGKTLMVYALSNEINVPLYTIGQITNEDESIDNIRDVFIKARKKSPCIIFIDVIDKLENNNDYIVGNQESNLVRKLLMQMDGYTPNKGIL